MGEEKKGGAREEETKRAREGERNRAREVERNRAREQERERGREKRDTGARRISHNPHSAHGHEEADGRRDKRSHC